MTVDLYMLMPYREEIVPSPCADGTVCYFARIPDLPGCESHGATPEEARENLREAKLLYIQSMLEDGINPPLPPTRTTGTGGGREQRVAHGGGLAGDSESERLSGVARSISHC